MTSLLPLLVNVLSMKTPVGQVKREVECGCPDLYEQKKCRQTLEIGLYYTFDWCVYNGHKPKLKLVIDGNVSTLDSEFFQTDMCLRKNVSIPSHKFQVQMEALDVCNRFQAYTCNITVTYNCKNYTNIDAKIGAGDVQNILAPPSCMHTFLTTVEQLVTFCVTNLKSPMKLEISNGTHLLTRSTLRCAMAKYKFVNGKSEFTFSYADVCKNQRIYKCTLYGHCEECNKIPADTPKQGREAGGFAIEIVLLVAAFTATLFSTFTGVLLYVYKYRLCCFKKGRKIIFITKTIIKTKEEQSENVHSAFDSAPTSEIEESAQLYDYGSETDAEEQFYRRRTEIDAEGSFVDESNEF